MHSERPLT